MSPNSQNDKLDCHEMYHLVFVVHAIEGNLEK